MDPILFFAFLTTTLLFVATPGPSVAFATAQALRHGPRAAGVAVAGDALGTMVHIAVAAASLATLMQISAIALPFLQIAGGAFIAWMGWRALTRPMGAVPAAPAARVTFWAGFFACVTNPKAIVFFVALFPSFISPDYPPTPQILILGAVFLLLDAASILAYALLALHAVRRSAGRWLNPERLSGWGLIGVGLAMVHRGWRAIPSS